MIVVPPVTHGGYIHDIDSMASLQASVCQRQLVTQVKINTGTWGETSGSHLLARCQSLLELVWRSIKQLPAQLLIVHHPMPPIPLHLYAW